MIEAPYHEARDTNPVLPAARGVVSEAVLSALRDRHEPRVSSQAVARTEPYGDDLQPALYLLYELHYQGFRSVGDDREWDADLLRLRGALEGRFLRALRSDVPQGTSTRGALAEILVEPVVDDGTGVSHCLRSEGRLWQVWEYAALRSLYHLKEADPHACVIPRLHGRAKAATVAVEYDEFGAGRAEEMHARLFANLTDDLGLDHTYGRYLDAAPAQVLCTVNVMSLFGLHRALPGLVGRFAAVEVTSSPDSRRLAKAMRRTGAGPAAEPGLDADMAFGIHAAGLLEDRLAEFLLTVWRGGRSALRIPLATTASHADRP
ncbi:iron-containing redox enzyme family protein [Streptomyces microflavus]